MRKGTRAVIGGLALAAMALPVAAQQQPIPLPSGQSVTFVDVIVEADPPVARFRFLAPDIDPAGRGLTYEEVREDFPVLCADYALPAVLQSGLQVPEVVISLADRPVVFGELTPEATQFFEPFSVADGTCIWEQF